MRRSCHTMAGVDGLAGVAVPDDGGLALVGDADGGHLGPAGHVRQRGAGAGELGAPDLGRVVLHPAGAREVLGDLALVRRDGGAGLVEDDGTGRGGALVEGQDVGHGGRWGRASAYRVTVPPAPSARAPPASAPPRGVSTIGLHPTRRRWLRPPPARGRSQRRKGGAGARNPTPRVKAFPLPAPPWGQAASWRGGASAPGAGRRVRTLRHGRRPPAPPLDARRAGPDRVVRAARPRGRGGVHHRASQEPVPRLLGRVRRAPRLQPRRPAPPRRLGRCTAGATGW